MSNADHPSRDILTRIRRIVRAINLESKKVLRDHGVSIPQVLCLGFLEGRDGKQATLKEVAGFLNLNSSTASGLVDRLEQKGLAVRLPKRGDRRTTLVALTSRGEKVLRDTPPLLQHRLTNLLGQVSEQEVARITEALDHLILLLGISEVEASPVLAMNTDLGSES